MIEQQIFFWEEDKEKIEDFFHKEKEKNFFVVGGKTCKKSQIMKCLEQEAISVTCFSEYSPNPKYNEVREAIALFRKRCCNYILAIGGGSAIDVAKCVKAFLYSEEDYLEHPSVENNIPLLVIPTTAGTGSEATQFAVLYHLSKKYSVDYPHIKPNVVMFEPKLLYGLSEYQKKATLMDALCQCIESYWALGRTEESKICSIKGIRIIIQNYKLYLQNDPGVYSVIQQAAYLSGQAINQTRTTAAHAMSYKLTSIYGIPHGHAVALCMRYLWPYMIENMPPEQNSIMKELCKELGNNYKESDIFEKIYMEFSFNQNYEFHFDRDIEELCDSVNVERLSNHPIALSKTVIRNIYKKIME